MALFKKKIKNKINLNDQSVRLDDVLLSALLNNETITRDKALTLPSVSGAVDFISGSIASMPVKLYKYKNGKVEEVQRDNRVRILNGDIDNTYDGVQTKTCTLARKRATVRLIWWYHLSMRFTFLSRIIS